MELPEWYWNKGLHDAQITNVIFYSFDYDYTQRNPVRNCLEIQLDSGNAMFDTSIKKIKLLNSKIVFGDTDFVNWFWKEDILIQRERSFELEISLISYPQIKKCRISFDKAIVEKI